MPVKVITDSTSYIPDEILRDLDIKKVSLYVSFEGETVRELDISNEKFYRMMYEENIPKSSQPSVGDFVNTMKEIIGAGNSVVGVFISSKMSGTYQSAVMAKEMLLEEYSNAEIEIVDSRTNCMELGLAAINGARAAKQGKTVEEVIEAIKNSLKRSRFIFIPESLKHLSKGGRIGKASALIGSLIQIIPVLTVEDGVTSVLEKVRTRKRAILRMIEKVIEDTARYGLREVIVHHINCISEARNIAGLIEEKLNVKPLIVDIGPVVGLHVGPGSVGIVYSTEKEMRSL